MAGVAPSFPHLRSCKQLMLLALCQVILVVFKTDAQSTEAESSGDEMESNQMGPNEPMDLMESTDSTTSTEPASINYWPVGLDNMNLWNSFNMLEQMIIEGGRLREADLCMRLARLPGKKKDPEKATKIIKRISDCQCRVECQADPECAFFVFLEAGSGSGTSSCLLYDRRGHNVSEIVPDPNAFVELKILSAAVGDICRIDLECSRRTSGATCNRDRSLGGDVTGICVCPGDYVGHKGECVDPATLTTTPPPTTTTLAPTTTPEPTTTPTEPPTTTPAPVAAQSLQLESLKQRAEWPCQNENNKFCNFQATMPASSKTPAHWKTSMESGTCGSDQRCHFPALHVTTDGAPRIEAWRGVGQFYFQVDDFLGRSPPDLPPSEYVAGSDAPDQAWTYDCSSQPGDNHMLMTGLLGVRRIDKHDKNIPRDVDMILCTRFTEVHLEVDASDGEVLDVLSKGMHECEADYVVTGLYDTDRHFLKTEKAKCSRLTRGKIDTTQCKRTQNAAASNTMIYWNACDQNSPRVVTGLKVSALNSDRSLSEWTLKCCKVSGDATSLNMT